MEYVSALTSKLRQPLWLSFHTVPAQRTGKELPISFIKISLMALLDDLDICFVAAGAAWPAVQCPLGAFERTFTANFTWYMFFSCVVAASGEAVSFSMPVATSCCLAAAAE